jgi:hypothetical protein
MTTIVIILGLTIGQVQERSSVNLDIASLYDYDARYIKGPIVVRYQTKNADIQLPESQLVSLSFELGVLIYANVTPHLRPLDGLETAKLCHDIEKALLHQGFVFRGNDAREFHKFVEGLKTGRLPAELPPWAFGFDLKNDRANMVIRPFESWSDPSMNSGPAHFLVEIAFSNSPLSDLVGQKKKAIRTKYFPDRQERIPMAEYPKNELTAK